MNSFYNEYRSKQMIASYGVPVGHFELASDKETTGKLAEKFGYPVALKIVSDQIIHKTEAKGILLNIRSRADAEDGYDRLISNAYSYRRDAVIEGVMVAPMAPPGVEVIAGGLRDRQFGPVLMFGLGGIFVEIFKDVQFRMAPVTIEEALSLIRSIKAYPMLTGARGNTPVNQEALAQLIVDTGRFLVENPQVTEIDLNPIICFDNQVQALDASIAYKNI